MNKKDIDQKQTKPSPPRSVYITNTVRLQLEGRDISREIATLERLPSTTEQVTFVVGGVRVDAEGVGLGWFFVGTEGEIKEYRRLRRELAKSRAKLDAFEDLFLSAN